MKRQIRNALGWACRGSGALARAEGLCRDVLTVLCYHRVLPIEDKRRYFNPDLVVSPEAFRAQCRMMKEHFDVRPLSEAVRLWERQQASRPLAAITFDDGYRDNFEQALPVLQDLALPATFFVIADLVNSDRVPWYDELAELVRHSDGTPAGSRIRSLLTRSEESSPRLAVSRAKKLSSEHRQKLLAELRRLVDRDDLCPEHHIMNGDQLRELSALGHEVGSHTCSHEILTQLSDERLRDELRRSKDMLAEHVGVEITSFCYPNGDRDARAVGFVREAGYHCAVTTQAGVNAGGQSRYELRRWFIDEDRLAGITGRSSTTLLRMELSGLSQRVFRREAHDAQ